MQNFRKLPAMKRKIAGASNKLGKMNEMIEKIKNDSEIDENIKKLMEQNLRYYVQKEHGIDAGFEKQEVEMTSEKNLIKSIILIVATALMQIATIEAKGHWIAGGNVVFPFLMAMLLWYVPNRIKEFKGLVKGEKFFKGEKLCL